MPGKLTLIEDSRVLYFKYTNPLRVEDIEGVNRDAKPYFDKTERVLHVLINVDEIRLVPPGVLRTRDVTALTHPRSGQIAIVGASLFVQSLSEAIFKVVRYSRAKFFHSDEQALVYLRGILVEELVPTPV